MNKGHFYSLALSICLLAFFVNLNLNRIKVLEDKVFLPPELGTVSRMVPGFSDFSSPSSSDPAPVSMAGPGRIMSTLELQRELNRRDPKLKLAVDGVYGPATKAAHERACGDQYAKELMVWGVE